MSIEKNMARNSGRRKLFDANMDNNIGLGVQREGEQIMTKDKYGFLPTSVWHVTKTKELVAMVDDKIGGGSFSKNGKKKKQGQENLSLFNPDVARRIIAYYSNPNDFVVAPFNSRGVWSIIGNMLGRNVHSGDVVRTYVEDTKERLDCIKASPNYNGRELEVFISDARHSVFESDKYDLLVASPPYWDVEKYESTEGQLSDIGTYESFLEDYFECIKDHYRITKPGGFAVYVVNDFRRNGEFIPFSYDTVRLFREAGFVYHDCIINVLNSRSVASIGQIEQKGSKIMAKSHEFIHVFKKPL